MVVSGLHGQRRVSLLVEMTSPQSRIRGSGDSSCPACGGRQLRAERMRVRATHHAPRTSVVLTFPCSPGFFLESAVWRTRLPPLSGAGHYPRSSSARRCGIGTPRSSASCCMVRSLGNSTDVILSPGIVDVDSDSGVFSGMNTTCAARSRTCTDDARRCVPLPGPGAAERSFGVFS